MTSPRLCLSIEIQEGMSYADTLAMTRAAEDLDFHAALLAEHYYPSGPADQYPDGLGSYMAADAWVFLAALARDTTRIRLGTLVSPVTFRHPSVLAKMAATLDHVSDGRAELGIGAGWFEGEHTAYGFPFPPAGRRVDLVDEQLAVVRGLWTSNPFSFEGATYQLRDCHFTPRPVQQPHPPIILGGGSSSDRMPRLAARYADEYVITNPTHEQCRAARQKLDAACERLGRDPATLPLSVFVGLNVGATSAEIERNFETFARSNPQAARMMAHRDSWIAGTPDQAHDQLEALGHLGIARVLLSVNCDLHREMLTLLGGQSPPARY